MRVEWAAFVQAVTGPANAPTLHGVGIGGVTVGQLPKLIPLTVMVRFVTPPHELGNEVSIGMEVSDPDLNVIHSVEGGTTPEAPENAIPGWEIRNWRPVQVRLQADREGVYTFRVRIDGELGWELPFLVRVADEPNS